MDEDVSKEDIEEMEALQNDIADMLFQWIHPGSECDYLALAGIRSWDWERLRCISFAGYLVSILLLSGWNITKEVDNG